MRLHYAWIVAGVTFLALLASAGIRATNVVLVLPLEHDFGWDRATVSLALSVNLLLYGLCGPFAGALMTRFGMRRVMLVVLAAMVATRWFVRRRGLVTGIFAASTATGQLIFLPGQAAIIEAYGWRLSVLLVAGVAIVVAGLVAVLMREDPKQLGLQAYGAEDEQPSTQQPLPAKQNPFVLAVDSLVQSAKVRDFWLLAGSFAICGTTTFGLISIHLIPA